MLHTGYYFFLFWFTFLLMFIPPSLVGAGPEVLSCRVGRQSVATYTCVPVYLYVSRINRDIVIK